MTKKTMILFVVLIVAVLILFFWTRSVSKKVEDVAAQTKASLNNSVAAVEKVTVGVGKMEEASRAFEKFMTVTNTVLDAHEKRIALFEEGKADALTNVQKKADVAIANLKREVETAKTIAAKAERRAVAVEEATRNVQVASAPTTTPVVKNEEVRSGGKQSVEIKKNNPTDIVRITWFTRKDPCKKK